MAFDPASMGLRQVAEMPEQTPLPKSNRNPYDKATIVSIFPVHIEEHKYTVQPHKFIIEPGTYEKPSLLVVGSSSWWLQPEGQPPVEILCSSVEIAEAVVNDYCRGLLGCDMEGKTPGLFWIPKAIKLKDLMSDYKAQLDIVNQRQRNWYHELVKLADSLWSRSQNPILIWDVMRLAARELGLLNKPWIHDTIAIEKVPCFACGSFKDAKYPVCPVCRAIDPNHELAKKVTFAGA